MDILEERYGLVCERIEQIYQETAAFSDERERYWHLCAGLALQKGIKDMHFLEYSVCSEVFGECGRYLCLLYAQMMQISGFAKNGQTELVCVCCELFVQIYRIVLDGEEISAVRNTLYWFFSDYCELYIGFWIERMAHGYFAAAGGPMLLIDAEENSGTVWKQHMQDFGLYMGSRFEERCYQAVMFGYDGRSEARVQLAGLCQELAASDMPGGFSAADWQRDTLRHLSERILALNIRS